MKPKAVRIGAVDYAIEFVNARDIQGDLGQIDHLNSVIRVCDNHARQETANSLLHEIVHGCYRQGALNKDDEEERVVTVLSNQFCQVMRDNPETVRWLLRSIR